MEDNRIVIGNKSVHGVEDDESFLRAIRMRILQDIEAKDEREEDMKSVLLEAFVGKYKAYKGRKVEGAIPITLNINQEQSVQEFTVSVMESQKIFEANEGYKFKDIVESFDPYVSVHTFEENDCAQVVSIYEKDKISMMTILLESNNLMYFRK